MGVLPGNGKSAIQLEVLPPGRGPPLLLQTGITVVERLIAELVFVWDRIGTIVNEALVFFKE